MNVTLNEGDTLTVSGIVQTGSKSEASAEVGDTLEVSRIRGNKCTLTEYYDTDGQNPLPKNQYTAYQTTSDSEHLKLGKETAVNFHQVIQVE